mmetsp:Transcript_63662/g.110959  ORF Transcript_63662/g.110959 Transcript_63662/m.110959 type:complete len:177 (+) Transcript_63662:69-599(+)
MWAPLGARSVFAAGARATARGVVPSAAGVPRSLPPCLAPVGTGALRWASREPTHSSDIRKGMIFLFEGKYVECEEWQPSKTGRGSQSYKVAYKELETGKPGETKFSSNAKVTRVEPDKDVCMVSYVDKETNNVVLADEDFNEVEVPVSRFKSAPAEGAKVVIWKDDETFVKVQVMQ